MTNVFQKSIQMILFDNQSFLIYIETVKLYRLHREEGNSMKSSLSSAKPDNHPPLKRFYHPKFAIFFAGIAVICIVLNFFSLSIAEGRQSISPGAILPAIQLNISDVDGAEKYLGVQNPKLSTLSQIPCKLLLIEVFSFYCPICHNQASFCNRVYKSIQQDPSLRNEIKFIGIGAGNNMREVEAFKANYKVPFPLFPDADFLIHKKLAEPRTPFMLLVDKKGKVLWTHHGVMENFDGFLGLLKKYLAVQ
jgi:hypothetical protein